jgi:hypothetical protein
VWRGRFHAERARAALLAAWNARFDAVQGPAEVRARVTAHRPQQRRGMKNAA